MIKVIFLDIDGVLNVMSQERDEYGPLFHKQFEDNLRLIIEKTDAKIVISSTWRFDGLKKMREMWKYRNLPGEIISITPSEIQVVNRGYCEFYDLVKRGHEIQLWMEDNPVEQYVILDDDIDMLESQMQNFIRCSDNQHHDDCVDIGYGLTKQCALKAIGILNRLN